MAARESFTLALRGIEKILSSIATTLPYQKVAFLYQTNLEFNQNTLSHSKSLSELISEEAPCQFNQDTNPALH